MPISNPIEEKIVRSILSFAISKEYTVSVFDGEEWGVVKSKHIEQIIEFIDTDEVTFRFRNTSNKVVGSISLIFGNEEDVIHDFSDNDKIREIVNSLGTDYA